jgi:hypothetical protein
LIGVPPPGGPGGLAEVRLLANPVAGQPDLWRLEGLRAGAWAVKDVATGLVSTAAEVGSGGAPAEVRLDLSRAGVVTGRVELPPGYASRDVRVLVEGEGLRPGSSYAFDTPGTPARADGTFSVRVAGDRPVTLSGAHPLLRPAAREGRVTLTAPTDGILLRMEAAPQASFRPDPVPSAKGGPSGSGDSIRVQMYRGATNQLPEASLSAAVADGVARFGGYVPGTWTLFLDAPGRSPALLPDVVLRDGLTDLGAVSFPAGGSVRVDVHVKEGQAPPTLSVVARSKLGPEHWREAHARNESSVVLRGLGKTRYEVRVESGAGEIHLKKLLDCDGVGETVLTLDLR